MCRIAGIASLDGESNKETLLKSMISSVTHGGPDDEGIFSDDFVVFGHRRLSIIDLSKAGHQPMCSSDGQLIITYNGEIYNYQTLRAQLERLGKPFRTRTDTEVIIQAYDQWGTQAFDMFEGIFAFALYDKRCRKLFLVRDHVGVKPLYYSLIGQKLFFSSEARALKTADPNWKENKDWKILFLTFGSIPQPYTTLDQVFQVLPGNYVKVNLKTFHYSFHEYSEARNRGVYTSESNADYLQRMKEAVARSVQKNLISDAPIGVFLSGGIDSSLLSLVGDRLHEGIKTISINFTESAYDESYYQKLVLERTRRVNHASYQVTEDMFWEFLPDTWKAMDQPTIDGVNSYFVSKFARLNGLKAVLSGLGADEVFGGYASFKRIQLLKVIRSFPLKRALANIIGTKNHAYRRLHFLNLPGVIGDYLFLRGIHTPDTVSSILRIKEQQVWEVLERVSVRLPTNLDNKEYASLMESKIYLVNQLLKDTDFMGMWHGLEVRVPFLDIELLREVESMPTSLRFNSQHKHLLTASHTELLPDAIVNRKKKGFTFPLAQWMSKSPMRFRELVDQSPATAKVINSFEEGKEHWSKYWSLAVPNRFY